eukprot:CAMPEP_0198139964 /NCGR_PEP_ID=MMETSP1443-20131203/3199_1 /TAXON_ID=186043 /ORGANISM="Entomoneis sp., Strain CCMP2396" /LENGTH=59 /DNA_ID=CAMNT_0043802249 /DNA_START=47 /DNA_END=223 /DNA_ORIENTATION=-
MAAATNNNNSIWSESFALANMLFQQVPFFSTTTTTIEKEQEPLSISFMTMIVWGMIAAY